MTLAARARPHAPTVASVPSGHVYVRHLAPEPGDPTPTPVRLADPAPVGVRRVVAGRWWPPAMLDPAWVHEHADEVDLVHLHFGFDALAPADLERWVGALRERGLPLLQTVHDLRNPHHADRDLHDAQLDVLVPAADAVVTLTPGAAAEIERRWGRSAVVLPHPHVVPLDAMAAARTLRERRAEHRDHGEHGDQPFRVGLHLKSLRASMAPGRVLPTLVDTVRELDGAVLQVDVHHDVMDPAGARHEPALRLALTALADAGLIDLRVHDYFTDDELFAYLASLDVAVLPYRFGTHSGWLEACRDLGVTVVAPTCGYLVEQGPVLSYDHDEDHYDAASLDEAVRTAWSHRPDLGATVDQRRRQRSSVAAAHDRLHRDLLGRSA